MLQRLFRDRWGPRPWTLVALTVLMFVVLVVLIFWARP
jgi:hypothetical protein